MVTEDKRGSFTGAKSAMGLPGDILLKPRATLETFFLKRCSRNTRGRDKETDTSQQLTQEPGTYVWK